MSFKKFLRLQFDNSNLFYGLFTPAQQKPFEADT